MPRTRFDVFSLLIIPVGMWIGLMEGYLIRHPGNMMNVDSGIVCVYFAFLFNLFFTMSAGGRRNLAIASATFVGLVVACPWIPTDWQSIGTALFLGTYLFNSLVGLGLGVILRRRFKVGTSAHPFHP